MALGKERVSCEKKTSGCSFYHELHACRHRADERVTRVYKTFVLAACGVNVATDGTTVKYSRIFLDGRFVILSVAEQTSDVRVRESADLRCLPSFTVLHCYRQDCLCLHCPARAVT